MKYIHQVTHTLEAQVLKYKYITINISKFIEKSSEDVKLVYLLWYQSMHDLYSYYPLIRFKVVQYFSFNCLPNVSFFIVFICEKKYFIFQFLFLDLFLVGWGGGEGYYQKSFSLSVFTQLQQKCANDTTQGSFHLCKMYSQNSLQSLLKILS